MAKKKNYIWVGILIIGFLLYSSYNPVETQSIFDDIGNSFGCASNHNPNKIVQCCEEVANPPSCPYQCVNPLIESEECSSNVIETQEKCEQCHGEWRITSCMANPSSIFCLCVGGQSITKTQDGGQYSVCKIGLSEYEEWDYYNTKCPNNMY
jgi:putative hemolysin